MGQRIQQRRPPLWDRHARELLAGEPRYVQILAEADPAGGV